MRTLPSDDSLDSTLALMRDPYGFVAERCDEHGSDVFETRILGQRTVCGKGPSFAELFYDEERLQRSGASPIRVRKTLFGNDGVQTLDDQAHRHRKRMFQELTTRDRAEELADEFERQWWARTQQWSTVERVTLYPELRRLLARSVIAWAGVPVDEDELPRRTDQIASLFEHAGTLGPQHWKARVDRWLGDRWAGSLVEAVRADRIDVPDDAALAKIARHRDADGERLAPRVAGVELLNVLRPTVAVAVYLVDVAHALHEHPAWSEGIEDEPHRRRWFVDEVRRLYPFFPAVVARARETFTWNGFRFPEGRRVLLDLHGTNRDPRAWEEPEAFRPERFRETEERPFAFVPQGGGDPDEGHRCPGEPVSVALMERFLACLEATACDVPDQDLTIDRTRLPALPRSGFTIADVQAPREGRELADLDVPQPRDPRSTVGW